MTMVDFRVAANGRMVLPKAIREAMGLHGDAKVTAIVDSEGVRLVPMYHRVSRARELYRQAIKTPRTTADFLHDRYEEAEKDEAGSAQSAT